MKVYLEMLQHILDYGNDRDDRTGTGTRGVFGYQCRYDLQDGFPLLTTKKLFVKGIIHELLWMLSGNTNVKYLQDNGVHIWDAWASKNGDLGPVYGAQFRRWYEPYSGGLIDQIAQVIEGLRKDPYSRRHVVSAWNVADLPEMALAPCHCLFQFYVENRRLSCQLYQRSADAFLGVPFNIASYALLTMMIAQVTGLQVGEFIHTFGDLHIYQNHMTQVLEQIGRRPRLLPTMHIDPSVTCIDDFRYEHFRLEGYDPHPAIKGEVSV